MSGTSTFPGTKFSKQLGNTTQFGLPQDQYRAMVALSDQIVSSKIASQENISGAADIDIDASTGSDFFFTLTGNRTVNLPTNPTNLQVIRLWVRQDTTGSRTLTWDTSFKFSTGLPAPTLTTTAEFTDMIEFIYDPIYFTWNCIRIVKGFDTVSPP